MSAFGYHDAERAALGFVLEDETWPLFLEWMRTQHISNAAHAWLDGQPSLDGLRREYLEHSPNEKIRTMADEDWIQP